MKLENLEIVSPGTQGQPESGERLVSTRDTLDRVGSEVLALDWIFENP